MSGIYHSPSLDIYPCAFRLFQVTPLAVKVETYQVEYPALVKKAKTNLLNSNLASGFSGIRPRTYVELTAGRRFDQNASLPLVNQ